MTHRPLTTAAALALALAGSSLLTAGARAQLTLTAAGTAAGFTLSTFASGFPTGTSGGLNVGPLGITFNGSKVIVSDYPGNVRVFGSDVDNQLASSATIGQTYATADAVGLGTVGSGGTAHFYMTQQTTGDVVEINSDGTLKQVIYNGASPSAAKATGLAVNPNNGHLFVSTSTNGKILDIDPVAKTATTFVSGLTDIDGLSTDGTTLYAEDSGTIRGYAVAGGASTFTSSVITGHPDGTALGYGSLAGNLFVNTNDGRLIEINLSTNAQTVIADSGTRGDFVTVDPNGSLLITQSAMIQRLTAPTGGSFTATTPEPGTVTLFVAAGVCGLGALRRRRGARK